MTLKNVLRITLVVAIVLGSAVGLLRLVVMASGSDGFLAEINVQVSIKTQDTASPSPAPECTQCSGNAGIGIQLAEWHDYDD